LHRFATAVLLAGSAMGAAAQTSNVSSYIGLPSSVAVGSLAESAPFQLANSAWT
jgi:hypothetical protein